MAQQGENKERRIEISMESQYKLAEVIAKFAEENHLNIVDISLAFTYYLWQQGYLDKASHMGHKQPQFSAELSYLG